MKLIVCSAANSNDAAYSNTFILHLESWLEKENQVFLVVEISTEEAAD